ncbi:glycoside hydrolase family 88/105 protein [Anaerobium acetethylicum]|uniref:Unsaturated rhamnogalacturonyl hydrolase n=1 Tax=Anaerobium acetethylicum TaxID=1619234 RepID=A0A1D3TVQ8_9FIRM|nr:glycoside hydrolase family 88 protein [Anaerobium acetethylicum]SCP98239.1 unsaturated rhamnogalacturonyl hydrolase [Anaerobium acetethylicum]
MSAITKFINEFLFSYERYQTYWNYEDGCVLMGCKQLYEATGDRKYYEYILDYLKEEITDDGTIVNFKTDKFNIDSMNCGKILFLVYETEKQEKYKKAIDFHMEILKKHPRCRCGSFWHKEIYPNQIWLDGLYMAQPFYMEYETKYNNRQNYDDILNQFENVQKFLYDKEKGLYYHGFDEARIQPWANKETGCSPNFWIRAMGWWLMSLVDVMDVMSIEMFEYYKRLEEIFRGAVKGILQYQDPDTKLFYQVIDHPEAQGNYIETSGSAMAAYAIMKACRMGILSKEKYGTTGLEMLESLAEQKLEKTDDNYHLTGICHVAGLGPGTDRDGSIEYYLSEPVVSDDAKGVGPFMMAYAQYLMLKKEVNE